MLVITIRCSQPPPLALRPVSCPERAPLDWKRRFLKTANSISGSCSRLQSKISSASITTSQNLWLKSKWGAEVRYPLVQLNLLDPRANLVSNAKLTNYLERLVVWVWWLEGFGLGLVEERFFTHKCFPDQAWIDVIWNKVWWNTFPATDHPIFHGL